MTRGALSTHVLQKEGVPICKENSCLLFTMVIGLSPETNSWLLVCFFLVTNVTLDQILLKTLEWNAGQWAAGSCWFGLFFLTERSKEDICSLLHSTAPWNQSGPWRNQDWVESQSPSLTIFMSSHATCFLWPSVHSPSKGINSQCTLLGG